jgi:hypothetical protein
MAKKFNINVQVSRQECIQQYEKIVKYYKKTLLDKIAHKSDY